MVELCLMASHGYPPGLAFHPDSVSCRVSKDCQLFWHSSGSRHGMMTLDTLNMRPRQIEEPWKPLSGFPEFVRVDSTITRPVLIDVQDTHPNSILFSFGISEQCTRHEKILKFLMSGSDEVEGGRLDLSMLSDLLGPQALTINNLHQGPFAPHCGSCTRGAGIQHSLTYPSSEFYAQAPPLELFGDLVRRSEISLYPNSQVSFTSSRTDSKDILSIVAEYYLSKNSTKWRKHSLLIGSDGESDGQGAPAEYDDDEELQMEEDEEGNNEEDADLEAEVVEEEEYEVGGSDGGLEVGGQVEAVATVAGAGGVPKQLDGDSGRSVEESTELHGVNLAEEEKKENEPFAVPTAGAFYMHDDRFRDNAVGRHRRTFGGRKLWESKDDRKWGHDKFEEMTLQERHFEEGTRNYRGRYRARVKNRGADHRYLRGGNKSKVYNNNNQSSGPKGVRGRGTRRYEPSKKDNNEAPTIQHKHKSGKSMEKTLHASSGRSPTATSNSESDPVPARKQVFASSLNSASPPFYPSGSSNKEISLTQKKDVQAGTVNRSLQSAVVDEKFSILHSNTMMRGKNVVDSIGTEKLYVNDSISPMTGKLPTSLQLPPSGSSLLNTAQPLQPRVQGRGLAASGQVTFQPGAPPNQVSRAPQSQLHNLQRSPVQSRVQPSLQASIQQLGISAGSGSQTSSPPKVASPGNSFEPGELESPPESSKSKTALVGKGQGSSVQASGRGSFLCGGAQVMGASGNMGSGHGDQKFAATPAFMPVMPFGGQHPGGIGVPAVGMAFPGYVAQPQLGLGNSEMTWLPVLAGAAGALGATYCSPYINIDGACHSCPSGQTSSSGSSSKENNSNKLNNEWKPSQRPEVASDNEFGQRQKNTRRYTEMNFSQ